MDTQTQIDRLIELAIIQRTELKQLVEQLPQLREHLNAEVEKVFEEAEPQLRSELEDWTTKQAADKTAALGVALEAKIAELSKNLEISTQARYNAIIAEREENARLAAQAEAKIAEHAASLPNAVKEIVTAELARFPRAGEIEQLRKEFAEPRGLNPRGKWQAGETYNRLDLVTYNGDSFVSNIDSNTEKPSRNAANWTLNAARGGYGGGGGITSLNDVLNAPTSGQIIGSQNGQYVPKTLVAGANITINETASTITIIGDEGLISLNDGTAASPALFFTNDTDTGIYRPSANTLGISTSGVQRMYVDQNGITTVGAGGTFDGSVHAANGNANNPSFSFSGDQDTGFFRHQPNEIGIALGGTQYATLTSTTFSITPNLVVSGTGSINGTTIPASKTLVVTTDKLSALASTSSSELAGVISDETGTGALVFANTPTLVTPNIGAATGTSVNLSGAGTFGGNLTVSGTATVNGSTIRAAAGTNGAARGLEFYNTGNSALFGTIKADYTSGIIAYDAGAAVYGSNHVFTHGTTAGSVTLSAGSITATGNLTVSGTGTSSFAGTLKVSSIEPLVQMFETDRTNENWRFIGQNGVLKIQQIADNGSFSAEGLNIATSAVTVAGNLTVSGTGNSTFAGNLGLGVTPSSWGSGWNVLQPKGGSIGSNGVGSFYINNNAYYDGSNWRYVASADATRYAMLNSEHYWYNANAGTAGNVITFTEQMRLFANGNLFIGASPVDGGQKLQVSGTAYVSGNLSSGARITAGNGFTATSTVPTVLAASTNLDYNSGTSKGRLFIWGPDSGTIAGFEIKLANSTNSSIIDAVSFDSSGNATFAGSVRPNTTPSTAWGIDFASSTSANTYTALASNATYDLADGSGMLYLFDQNGAGLAQIALYYGATTIVWQSGSGYSTGAGTASKVNVFYNAGTSKYRIENKTAGALSMWIGTVRLRPSN